jgi:hypothetical protein
MEWDPCTFNNNDWTKFPTYHPINAARNWSILSGQRVGLLVQYVGETGVVNDEPL